MRLCLAVLALWSVFSMSSLSAEDLADRFEKRVFVDDGAKLGYRFLAPKAFLAGKVKDGEKFPLVIFLHGAGERGDDNTAQLIHGVKRFAQDDFLEKYPCFVVAPQCPNGKIWASFSWLEPEKGMLEEPTEPMALLVKAIDSMQVALPIDSQRIYVTGLSMGGYGTWELAIRHPKRFAAIAPVCGGADLSRLAVIKDVPTWVFHGAKDGAVKVERSREAIETLKKAGGKPIYTEYPEVGHDSWNNAYADLKFYEWLFAQKLPAAK